MNPANHSTSLCPFDEWRLEFGRHCRHTGQKRHFISAYVDHISLDDHTHLAPDLATIKEWHLYHKEDRRPTKYHVLQGVCGELVLVPGGNEQ